MKIAISICVVAIFTTLSMYAQKRDGREVDIKIYFPYDESYIDSTYMNNPHALHLVDSLLSDTSYIATLRTIEITAQSSPEGRIDYNERLSLRRKESLAEYFTTTYPHIDEALWSFNSVAENWEEFNRMLVEDPNLPHRDRVLSISNGDRTPDDKEWLLKTMQGGKTWLYIKEHILPTQRYGASMLFIPIVPPFEVATSVGNPSELKSIETTYQSEEPTTFATHVAASTSDPKLLFAIKTNMLLDVVSVVNLAVEVPIGQRWSVVGEVAYPWWRSWSRDFTMQIESYHAEVKYWLGDRSTKEQLQGWSVGLYGGWGRYDIQPFSRTGVQGSLFDVGAHVGFSHPIARNWHMEYTVGLGYLSTTYEDYKMAYDTDEYGDIKVIPYPWMQNSLKSIFPTRCGVSLVWLIKSKGGENR